jgi:Ni/Co efflux regulator RcnB
MKKLLLTLAATVAIAAPLALNATPAQADPGSPKCMTLTEWRKIKANDTMSRAKVKQITGIYGKVTNRSYFSDGTAEIDVDYRQCLRNGRPAPAYNTVWLSYDNYHYSADYSQEYRTNFRVDYKGSWSTPYTW